MGAAAMKRRALLIAGPTASGKSAAALALAQKLGGTIVNADSMQVYRDLRVLTARPNASEEGHAPHELFGCIDGAVNFSAGRWLAEAKAVADRIFTEGVPAIFVGGTGLYFRALTQGFSEIPAVPDDVRAQVRTEAEPFQSVELHAQLALRDSATAARLRPSDRQRILRALEVLAATGQPLASFQGARGAALLAPGQWTGMFLAPDRETLNATIDRRFAAMLRAGALEEVAALAARKLDPALPVMRAHGVPHLIAHLNGDLSLDEAASRSALDTRRYAKRQFTWARHQMPEFAWVAPDKAVEAGERAFDGFL
ncbi:tRNA (adenosine(37)-N6)-dimethylallyltransferase MiaA [Methylocapsa sp. S129]|uniref:tRNA (adenosine(37)-N6)-dimethylallyltransferase MiaA n=1 Tax=Methylocapsa sp. S129 TaxID=1641869 RepID=UPI001FEDA9B1|nr:tRNA (adenosine(37)-N6)-dimethylallyltransferase MiaA [Methylocapsa sp. S129]